MTLRAYIGMSFVRLNVISGGGATFFRASFYEDVSCRAEPAIFWPRGYC